MDEDINEEAQLRFQPEDSEGGTVKLNFLFLTRYMKSFLIDRNRVIKATAESDDWKQFIRHA